MSELKCPFCNGELVGTIGHPICRNQDCVMCDDPMPQDLLEALIRTRKALGIAVDALKLLNSEGKRTMILGLISITDTALDKIKTALERKDK